MNKNDDAAHNQPDDQNYFGADIEDCEVKLALGTLRLLNDAQNPRPLGDALREARRLADSYARWEESGALIKQIRVCLSDGQKITMEQSTVSGLCGLHIRRAFDPDAVLQIWKKGNDPFDEVLLLSFMPGNMDRDVYQYQKRYRNGQILSLRVEPCANEQLDISVDFTVSERTAADAGFPDWLSAFHPAAFGFSVGDFLRHSLETLSRRVSPNRVRIRESLLARLTLKPRYFHPLQWAAVIILAVVAAMQGGVLSWGPQQEGPANGPAITQETPPAPPPLENVVLPPGPLATPQLDDFVVRAQTSNSGSKVIPKRSDKPHADMLLNPDLIGGSERTSTAENASASNWRALVKAFAQKVKIDEPSLKEMGWPLVVDNSKSGTFRIVEGHTLWRSDVSLTKADSIYVEEPDAPSLSKVKKKRMRKSYIDLFRQEGYSVRDDLYDERFSHQFLKLLDDFRDEGSYARTLVRLRYESERAEEDEQVHIELYVEGQLKWSTRKGCPAKRGLWSGLCEKSLSLGQSFRSQRLSRGD